jgi:hypothetical protein
VGGRDVNTARHFLDAADLWIGDWQVKTGAERRPAWRLLTSSNRQAMPRIAHASGPGRPYLPSALHDSAQRQKTLLGEAGGRRFIAVTAKIGAV